MTKSDDILDDIWEEEKFDLLKEIDGLAFYGDKHKICVSNKYLIIFDREISQDGYLRRIELNDIEKIGFSYGNRLEINFFRILLGGPFALAYFYFEAVEASLIVLGSLFLVLFFSGRLFNSLFKEKPHGFKVQYKVDEEDVTSYFETNLKKSDLKEIDQLIIRNLNKTD